MKLLLLTGAPHGEKILVNMAHVVACDFTDKTKKETRIITSCGDSDFVVTETPTEIYNLLNQKDNYNPAD